MEILFAALEFEISGLLRLSRAEKIYKKNNLIIYLGRYGLKPFLFVKTGMGKENVSFAFDYVFHHYLKGEKTLDKIYCFGFCGVSNSAAIADIVLYESVVYDQESPISLAVPYYPEDVVLRLQKVREDAGIDIHFFKAASVLNVVSEDANKINIKERLDVAAFDMESFFLLKEAKKRSIHAVIIRSISDNIENPIPFGLAEMSGKKIYAAFFIFMRFLFASEKNLPLFLKTFNHFKKAKKSLLLAFIEIFKEYGSYRKF